MYYLMTDIDRNYYATILMAALIIISMLLMMFQAKAWPKFKELLNPTAQFLDTRNVVSAMRFIPEAVITTNSKGIILHVNERTRELFEWTGEELLGKRITAVLPDIENFNKFYSDHSDTKEESFPKIEAIKKTKERFASEVIIGKWEDELKPETFYYTIIIRNISHRKANEEARAALQRQINTISGLSVSGEFILQSGAWSWDMINDIVDCSAGFCRVFNIQPSERLTATEVISHIYFEDHPHLTQAMHNCMENKVGYDIQFRVVQKNGSKDLVRSIGIPVLNDNGKMVKLNGALIMLTKNV